MSLPVGQQQSLTSGRFWLLLGSLILLHFSWWHCYFSAACSWDLFARATSRQAIPSTSRQACSCYNHGACSGKRPPSEDTQQTNQSQKNMHPTNASIFRESCARHPVIIANQHRCTKLKPSALYPTRCTVSTHTTPEPYKAAYSLTVIQSRIFGRSNPINRVSSSVHRKLRVCITL